MEDLKAGGDTALGVTLRDFPRITMEGLNPKCELKYPFGCGLSLCFLAVDTM